MNAHYIYTEQSEGIPAKLRRALKSNLNLDEIINLKPSWYIKRTKIVKKHKN